MSESELFTEEALRLSRVYDLEPEGVTRLLHKTADAMQHGTVTIIGFMVDSPDSRKPMDSTGHFLLDPPDGWAVGDVVAATWEQDQRRKFLNFRCEKVHDDLAARAHIISDYQPRIVRYDR